MTSGDRHVPAAEFDAELARRVAALAPGQRDRFEAALRRNRVAAAGIPARPAGTDAPASAVQRRLWLHSRLSPQIVNFATALRLRGPLVVPALRCALLTVAARHEVLRTTFSVDDADLVQVVHEQARVPFAVVDLSGADPDLDGLLRADSRRPFDLAGGPLLRVTLFRLGPADHVGLLAIHHTVNDGWSTGILIDEVATAYGAALEGTPHRLAPLPVQFGDFAFWEQVRFGSGSGGAELARLRHFWTDVVRDLPAIDLPADRSDDGSTRRGIGATHRVRLLEPLSTQLMELRAEAGGSVLMLVLTALVVVLRTVTGQDDVVVGTLTSGRGRPELQRLLGVFVNQVVLRIDTAGVTRFDELWARVRRVVTDAISHQDLPFETVLELAREGGWTGPGPALRVVCVAQQASPLAQLHGLDVTDVEVELRTAQFDLVVELQPERDGGLLLAFQYDTAVFSAAAARQLGEHLREVLVRAVAGPERPWADLLPAEPEPTADTAFGADPPTLAGMVEARVRHDPDAIAVVEGRHRISLAALDRRANRLAGRLRGLGVRPEDRVGLLLARSADAIVAMLAAAKVGAPWLALEPGLPQARLADQLADAGVTCLLTTAALLGDLPDLPAACVLEVLDGPVPSLRGPGDVGAPPIHVDNAAYFVHTSGSTGSPKGVLGTHRGMVTLLRGLAEAYPWEVGEVAVARTPLPFVDSVVETFGPLAAGVPLVVLDAAEAADPGMLVARLRDERVSRLLVVPSLLTMLLDTVPDLDGRLPDLRIVLTSGEPLPTALARRCAARLPGRRLLNLYGSSETSADATVAEIRITPTGDGDTVPIGRPFPGMKVSVRDRAGARLPVMAPGELWIGGCGLARGYHARPGATAARFTPEPGGARAYRSGDLARVRADGELEHLGRTDRQLHIRGQRVELGEVEHAVERHPGVRAAAVLAHSDAVGSMVLTAYVQPREPSAMDPAALRAFLRGLLPAALVPARVVHLPALPHTVSGKIDRRALPAPQDADPARGTGPSGHPDPPVTATERVVGAVFADLLPGFPDPGQDGDFFSAGGHSLLAARMVAVLQERLGVEIGLHDILEATTVAALAARIEARGPAPEPFGDRPLVPDLTRGHEPFPLTPVQQAYVIGRDPGLDLGAVSTHGYLEVLAPGLDVERFAAALRSMIVRHPMLRAVVEDGRQRVLPEVTSYQPAVLDLTGLDGTGEREHLARVRAQMSHQVLPADTWPLFDVRISLRRTGPPLLHVSIDALICDAHSLGLLMADLAQEYVAPGTLPAAPAVDFRDYVLRDRDEPRRASALAYWRERVRTLPVGPELPLAVAPAEIALPRAVRRQARLTAGRWHRLRSRATAAGLSPSGLLLGAFAEVVTNWSRRPHYSITLTVFDRKPVHPDIDRVVGDFTSLSVLEVDHSTPGTFVDRARALQRRLWQDLEHAEVGAVEVLREWAWHHGSGLGGITPVVFTSNLAVPASAGTVLPPGWSPRFGITQTPQVALDYQVADHHGELLLNWDAVDALFEPGVLDVMFAAHLALLETLADDTGAWRRPVVIPLPADQAAHRDQVNDTAVAVRARCLPDLVSGADDRTALVDGPVRLTYRELRARARSLGAMLRRAGGVRGSLIAVLTPKGWQQVVAAVAVAESGAAFLPIDPAQPAERVRTLLRLGGVDLGLTQTDQLDRLADIAAGAGVRLFCVDDGDAHGADPNLPAPAPDRHPHDLAYVVFTSGSTGEPKGVMIDHQSVVNTIDAVNRRFGVGPADRVLAVSSLSFDLAVYDIFGILDAGGAVVLPDRTRQQDPRHWAELVAEHGVTIWNSVPALAGALADHVEALVPDALATVRLWLLSGDWIPTRLPGRLCSLDPDSAVVGLGGATEGSIWSVWYPVNEVDPRWRSIPYGTPMDNQTMHVLDALGRPRPQWVAGDLFIGGAGVARGYWRDAERTAASFPADPADPTRRLYRTGDIARYLPGAVLEFLGREDDQFKISGYRVELGEIEAALATVDGVRESAVVAVGEPRGEKRLVGFVVTDGPEPAAVRARLAELLPAHLVPPLILARPDLPFTTNGKIDRAALARQAEEARRSRTSTTDPLYLAGLQASLCAMWAAEFGVPVAPDDGFFELGGTSLTAMRLVTAVHRDLGVRMTLSQLLAAPTAARFAELVADAARGRDLTGAAAPRPDPGWPPAVPDVGDRFEPFPLTPVQAAYLAGRRVTMALGGVATHAYVEVDVDGVDLDALQHALHRLIVRHDALRIVIDPSGLQRVLPDVAPYRIRVRDLTAVDPDERETELERLRAALSHKVYEPDVWPLFEVTLTTITPRRSRLHIGLDMLIADANSVAILTDELIAGYERPRDVQPELGLTFRDYVLAVEHEVHGDEHRRAVAYWQRRVQDLPAAPGLPLLRRPEEIDTPRFERFAFELEPGTWAALGRWASAAGLTPAALCCAAFCEVLATWSDSPRFTLNLTTFNRLPLHPEVDRLVGEFSTTTLLAIDHTAPSFAERARAVQARTWESLEHRSVSGIEVLRMLRRSTGSRADTLMPVVFTSTLALPRADPGPPAGAGPGDRAWRAEPAFAISQTPQVLLDAQIAEADGRLLVRWDVVTAAFPARLVEDMLAAYRRLFTDLVDPAELPTSEAATHDKP